MIKVYATMEVKNNLITKIPFKGVQVRVEFTGGNSMKNIPAKFYTKDPFTQKALDSSDQNGRLYFLYQTIKEEEDVEKATVAAPESPAAPETPVENQKTASPKAPAATETPSENQASEEGQETADSDKMEFENLGAAITYIATKYGEQVETESAARKFIFEKEGVKPVIHKG